MHLYCKTLQKASGITSAVYGNFSGPKQQEIVVARGKILELLRPDDNGKVQMVHSTEVFGLIRSVATFRLTGGNRDYLVVGSDSGAPARRHSRPKQQPRAPAGRRQRPASAPLAAASASLAVDGQRKGGAPRLALARAEKQHARPAAEMPPRTPPPSPAPLLLRRRHSHRPRIGRAGKVVILEYSPEKQCFSAMHAETYGKSGLRRIVPGQYVAVDPRGRAVMVGAIEKQKLVYILNR